jgi:hypothetical protein
VLFQFHLGSKCSDMVHGVLMDTKLIIMDSSRRKDRDFLETTRLSKYGELTLTLKHFPGLFSSKNLLHSTLLFKSRSSGL